MAGAPTRICFSPKYNYIRSLQLEGRYPRDLGVWPINSNRVRVGWGELPEDQWPESPDGVWPPDEPPGVDEIAKCFRAGYYQRVRSSEDARAVISGAGMVVPIGLHVTRQWLQGGTDGAIDMPGPDDELVGKHMVRLYRYEDGRFRFANSWGAKWGDGGYGTVPYEYVDRYIIDAYAIVQNPPPMESRGSILHTLSPRADHFRGVYLHQKKTDELEGWAFAFERDGYLDVEELFVRPTCRRLGYGTELARELLREEKDAGMPIRVWVPQADCEQRNMPGVRAMMQRLGLTLERSPFQWARHVATRRGTPRVLGAF